MRQIESIVVWTGHEDLIRQQIVPAKLAPVRISENISVLNSAVRVDGVSTVPRNQLGSVSGDILRGYSRVKQRTGLCDDAAPSVARLIKPLSQRVEIRIRYVTELYIHTNAYLEPGSHTRIDEFDVHEDGLSRNRAVMSDCRRLDPNVGALLHLEGLL